jgi:hypothetical protein
MSSRIIVRTLLLTMSFIAPVASQTRASQSVQFQTFVTGLGNDSDFDGHWDTTQSGCCLAYNGLPSTYNFRSAIEFDLQSIPSTATIESATFFIQYDGASGSPADYLQFNRYVGNGTIDLSDYEQINQIGPLRNSFGPGDGTLWYKIPVAPIVQSFVSGGDRFLGIMVQNTLWNQTALLNPYLAVTFVPEPTTLSLTGLIVARALFWRRKLR